MAHAWVQTVSGTSHIISINIVDAGAEDDITQLTVKVLHSTQEEHKIIIFPSSSCGYAADRQYSCDLFLSLLGGRKYTRTGFMSL